MSEEKFTPAPWVFRKGEIMNELLNEENKHICMMFHGNSMDANARIIIAAPIMFKMLSVIDYLDAIQYTSLRDQIKELLKVVRGEE